MAYLTTPIFESQQYCSEVLNIWNFLEKNHYENIWRVEIAEKVMLIIQLLYVLQKEVVPKFFLIQTYW